MSNEREAKLPGLRPREETQLYKQGYRAGAASRGCGGDAELIEARDAALGGQALVDQLREQAEAAEKRIEELTDAALKFERDSMAEIAALKARVELLEKLREYATHEHDCPRLGRNDRSCTCGMEALAQEILLSDPPKGE